MTQELSVAEFGELQQCENDIETGGRLMVFGLMRVHSGKLYREQYETFDKYCEERWDMTGRQGRRMVTLGETLSEIKSGPNGSVLPQNERQIRPLTRLPLADRAAAWGQVVDAAPKAGDGHPQITAKQVDGVVQKLLPEEAKRKTKPPPTQKELNQRTIRQALEMLAELPFSGVHAAEMFDEKGFGKKFRVGLNWAREMHGALIGKDPISIPLIDGTFYHPPAELIDEMQKAFPTVDIEERLRFIQGWNYTNAQKRKTRRGIKKHIFYMLTPRTDNRFNGGSEVDENEGRHQAL